MSNIQNIDISLQEIVKKIAKDAYLIPKFQRDFVWKTKDILDYGLNNLPLPDTPPPLGQTHESSS